MEGTEGQKSQPAKKGWLREKFFGAKATPPIIATELQGDEAKKPDHVQKTNLFKTLLKNLFGKNQEAPTNVETNAPTEEEKNLEPPQKPRTYGILPEGSTVKKHEADTKTRVEYAKPHWTTGQTVRDILQNHLDANTQQFLDKLVSAVIDVNKLSEKAPGEEEDIKKLTYILYRFKKGMESFSPSAETEMIEQLNKYADSAPIKQELLDDQKKISLEALKKAITPIVETPPKIVYLIKDSNPEEAKNDEQWLTYDELQQAQYLQKIGDPSQEEFRYQIVGMKIEDQGSGFDAKLSTFYKSTKSGQRHLRGKFGEGAKISAVHLIRNGANVKMRSRFEINGEEPAHDRIWQHRAYLGEEDTVQQKGIQVDLPAGEESTAGSFTLITIDQANSEFQQDFRANVDPRIQKGGLAQNCLEYSSSRYYYPMSGFVRDGEIAVGVSLEASAQNQYVQGLRVVTENNHTKLLFSYDFLDSSILKGRDRNELNREMDTQIRMLWLNADSQMLVSELIRRVKTANNNLIIPEIRVVDRILSGSSQNAQIKLDTQDGRTTMYALMAFPVLVGAKPDKKNIIVDTTEYSSSAQALSILRSRGYNIITFPANISLKSINNLNQAHEGKYQFYSLNTAQAELQSASNEIDQNDERVILSKELFNTAYTELEVLAKKASLKIEDFNINLQPQFYETVNPAKETPFDLFFDEATKKFQINIRHELLAKAVNTKGGLEYWKRRIQVELLATYKRNEKFPDQNTLFVASQDLAQQILENTLHTGLADIDALPRGFAYETQIIDPVEAIKRFSKEQTDVKEALVGWDLFRSITKFQTLAEMEKVYQNYDQIPEPYRQKVKDVMTHKIVLEDGIIGYYDYSAVKDDFTFVRKNLDELQALGNIEGKPVYQVGNKLFMPWDFPDGTVIKTNAPQDDEKYVIYGNQLLYFGKYYFGSYQSDPFPVLIVSGGFSMYSSSNLQASLQAMEEAIKKVEVASPEQKSPEDMKFLSGSIETPFYSTHGTGEWDKPIRVFQDIIQNHLDASPTSSISIRYEVQRGKERFWFAEEEITATDIIVGLSIADDGEGYTPNNIGTLGESSKKSPFFAGKYGEGQKMIAAAAVRNGLELTFSSVANYSGTSYRWQGVVGTKAEEIIIGGKPTNAEKVIINVTSNQAGTNEGFASSTIIRLPQKATQNSDIWQEWLKTIDPRIKDQQGAGGLSRYVLPMRATKGERIIDMGYMRILLDRPGEVYENGLLITEDSGTAVGYDVPEVVSNRDRNSFDSYKLSKYITNAIYTCSDPAYALALIKQFKDKYLLDAINNPNGAQITEQDLNFGNLTSDEFGDFIPAKPNWRQACNDLLGDYLVYSEEALRDQIRTNSGHLNANYTRDEEKPKYIKEIEEAYAALANVRHVPSEHIINSSSYDYLSWCMLFPTVTDYVKALSEQEITVSENITSTMEAVVAASSNMLLTSQDNLKGTEDGQKVFESIVRSKTPEEVYERPSMPSEITTTEQFDQWTPNALQQYPGRVFIAPASAGYLGLATRDRIGFNEKLLVGENFRGIPGIARHELIHKIYGLRDYTPEFIMLLLESAKSNISQ